MARISYLMLTTALAVAGSVVRAGTVVEVSENDATDIKRRSRGRDATPEEIASYLEEVAQDALDEAEAVRADAPGEPEQEPETETETPPEDETEGESESKTA